MEWLPFDLHPEYPPEGIPAAELDARYGGAAFRESLSRLFDAAGLPHARDLDLVPNSRKALRLGELARDRGRHGDLHARLFDAYWVRGLDIGDDEVLIAEASAAGLDAGEVRETLESDRYLDVVHAETQTALATGATGVPAWVLDGRLLVPGAQPHDVFERVLDRLGHTPVV